MHIFAKVQLMTSRDLTSGYAFGLLGGHLRMVAI